MFINLLWSSLFLFLTETAAIPAIDLGFAISANAVDADKTFELMRDSIGYVVNKYGTNRLRYAVIIFGSSTTTYIDFGQYFPNSKSLKQKLSVLSRSPGTPDLEKALAEAKTVFQLAPSRPNSKKVKLYTASLTTGKILK